MATLTLMEAVIKGSEFLKRHDVAGPRLDAEILAAYVLGCNRMAVYLQHERPLSVPEADALRGLLARRAQHIPIAYLVGKRSFMDMELEITPDVLIPRPETEELVEMVAKDLGNGARLGTDSPVMADVGTGSGCIACALAHMFPQSSIVAVDCDEGAVALTRRNLAAQGAAERSVVTQGIWCAPLLDAQVNVLVSNPPYVTTSEMEELDADVTHEPRKALDGGADGLDCYRELLASAKELGPQLGYIALEVDYRRAQAVADLFPQWWAHGIVSVRDDLTDRPRFVVWDGRED